MNSLIVEKSNCFLISNSLFIPGVLKTGLAKKSSHSTTWQLKTIKNHSKAN